MKIKHNFAKKIRSLRKKTGLTQAQLADKLNVSASAVGMYEQGRREPDNETLSKICKALGTTSDYILDLSDSSNKICKNSEVYSVISSFIDCLEKQDNLMFNGEPINDHEKKRIATALKVATAVTLSDMNCEL